MEEGYIEVFKAKKYLCNVNKQRKREYTVIPKIGICVCVYIYVCVSVCI